MTEIQAISDMLAMAVNEQIETMESEMFKHEQVHIPVEHLFVNGMYARKIMIPAGTVLTGRVHKFGYVDIMLSGEISVATPDGVRTLSGFNILEGKAGRKRAGYAHTDVHWVTVHRTEETDPDGIEDKLTVMTMLEYQALPVTEKEVELCQLLQQQ